MQVRPCVVLPESSGAAGDIYEYVVNGKLPVEGGERRLSARYVKYAAEVLPQIKKLGSELKGANLVSRRPRTRSSTRSSNAVVVAGAAALSAPARWAPQVPQLTFFLPSDDPEGRGTDLSSVILEAVLSDCEKTSDAIM